MSAPTKEFEKVDGATERRDKPQDRYSFNRQRLRAENKIIARRNFVNDFKFWRRSQIAFEEAVTFKIIFRRAGRMQFLCIDQIL